MEDKDGGGMKGDDISFLRTVSRLTIILTFIVDLSTELHQLLNLNWDWIYLGILALLVLAGFRKSS